MTHTGLGTYGLTPHLRSIEWRYLIFYISHLSQQLTRSSYTYIEIIFKPFSIVFDVKFYVDVIC